MKPIGSSILILVIFAILTISKVDIIAQDSPSRATTEAGNDVQTTGSASANQSLTSEIDSFFKFPKSQFTNEKNFGVDPFFPHSARRNPKKKLANTENNTPKTSLSKFEKDVKLEGVSFGVTQRIAMINGKTFEEGESKLISVAGSQIPVRCMIIRKKSVLVKFLDQNHLKVLKIKELE